MWVGEHSRQGNKLVDNGNDSHSINPGMHELHFYSETPFHGASPSSRRVPAKLQGGVPCPDVGGESASDTEPVLNPSGPRGSRAVLGHLCALSPCSLAAPCPGASFL